MILHIGMPKTGTKTLQRALYKAGLLSPDTPVADHTWGHNALGFEWDRKRYVQSKTKSVIKPRGPVVSEESLVLADMDEAAEIKRVVAPDEVILVTRKFSQALESWWNESVKGGESRTFTEWVNDLAFAHPNEVKESRCFRADWAAAAWRPTHVIKYSTNVLNVLAKTFGWDIPTEDESWNVSFSPEGTEAIRRFNRAEPSDEETLAAVDVVRGVELQRKESVPRLLSQQSALELASCEARIQAAISVGGVANLRRVGITVRPVDEQLVRMYLALIERQ